MSEFLKGIYCFEDLDDDELGLVAGIAKTRKIAKGETVVKEGVQLDHFYIIKEGAVSLTVTMDSGDDMIKADEEIIGQLKPGECVGEFALLDNQPASVNVIADSELTILEIESKEFMGLIEKNHGICRKVLIALLKTLVGRLRKTDKDLVMSRYFERMR
ncbi:Crp/Fnr family transcriptional regulator [Acidobacteriota bacterium]